jgi:cellulose synthase/poly-beta-1,6-N-acetylglucosamine synthase-like glycosyltransferase
LGRNLSVRREVFEAVGGFDEDTFTIVGGEDVDFCLRLRDAGYTIATAPDAVAFHARDHITSFLQLVRKLFLYGRSSIYNCVRKPRYSSFHTNPVAVILLLVLFGAGVGLGWPVLYVALGTASSWWLLNAIQLMILRRSWAIHRAIFAVALEWSFEAGSVLEALRRGRPLLVFRRFRYFDEKFQIPLSAASALRPGAESSP